MSNSQEKQVGECLAPNVAARQASCHVVLRADSQTGQITVASSGSNATASIATRSLACIRHASRRGKRPEQGKSARHSDQNSKDLGWQKHTLQHPECGPTSSAARQGPARCIIQRCPRKAIISAVRRCEQAHINSSCPLARQHSPPVQTGLGNLCTACLLAASCFMHRLPDSGQHMSGPMFIWLGVGA